MPLKKGDIIDEFKQHPDGCGLVVKIMGGGEGFEKIICCGHELTEADVVSQFGSTQGRKKAQLPLGVILDEKKLYPNSCGLRVIIMDGGAGFKEIMCCGHSLTLSSIVELNFGQRRDMPSGSTPPERGPYGTA